jgi:BMFP domain-containing protein YqiC
MPADKNLLDDIAKVAGGAVSLISTVRRQVKSDVRGRMDSYANRLDLAPREEVERLQAQVAMFRSEQDSLKKRITELEALVMGQKPAAKVAKTKPPAKSKPATKKTASKSKRK